jgi:hypothetical protein
LVVLDVLGDEQVELDLEAGAAQIERRFDDRGFLLGLNPISLIQ